MVVPEGQPETVQQTGELLKIMETREQSKVETVDQSRSKEAREDRVVKEAADQPLVTLARDQVSPKVDVVAREQPTLIADQPGREQLRPVEPTQADPVEPSRPEPSQAHPVEPASQVQTSSDCLRCGFGCNNEDELDNHMEQDHHVPNPIQRALHPGGMPCQDCQSKESLSMEHI